MYYSGQVLFSYPYAPVWCSPSQFQHEIYFSALCLHRAHLCASIVYIFLTLHLHLYPPTYFIYTEYTGFLNELTPPLPNPKRCSGYHCESKPLCFTDYRPHYSTNMSLSELVVGENKWDYDAGMLCLCCSVCFCLCFAYSVSV